MNNPQSSVKRRIYDNELYAHFITTSCYNRRQVFTRTQAIEIFEWALASELKKYDAHLPSYIIMPEHVHFIVWFPKPRRLATFMKGLKQRSSKWIRKNLFDAIIEEWGPTAADDPIWQSKYYAFEIWSDEKLEEKLLYIHENPVRKEYCRRASDWKWSSARFYETKEVGNVLISRP